ncbi:Hypothetical predicted protein, partial [Pelobates cultripes]
MYEVHFGYQLIAPCDATVELKHLLRNGIKMYAWYAPKVRKFIKPPLSEEHQNGQQCLLLPK